jgi:hypothetical protein
MQQRQRIRATRNRHHNQIARTKKLVGINEGGNVAGKRMCQYRLNKRTNEQGNKPVEPPRWGVWQQANK